MITFDKFRDRVDLFDKVGESEEQASGYIGVVARAELFLLFG